MRRPSALPAYQVPGSSRYPRGMDGHATDLLFRSLVLREYASEVMNVLGEYVALAALKPGRYEAMVAEALADGHRCWPIVEEWVNSREDFDWVKPKAGYLCFVGYHLDIGSRTSAGVCWLRLTALSSSPARRTGWRTTYVWEWVAATC